MAMNKVCMRGGEPVEMMMVPAAAFTQMFFDVQILAELHADLIQMYEKESKLKKHHKAYLHVRDEADEKCRCDKVIVARILDHYENPEKYLDQANCFHNHMKAKHQERSEKCDEMVHIPSEKCEEKSNAVSSDSKKAGKDMDAFDLPHGMVMMSTGTLGTIQDDMLGLAYAVDQLVDAFRDIEEGGGYDRNKMNIITGSAADLARDVFSRWDDAELAELG